MKITADFLYGRLPKTYRQEDEKLDKPLYRFLQVIAEGGFKLLEQDIERFGDIFDPDKCPREFLPFLSSLLGLDFPFDMPEALQRRFIKVAASLYKTKGTAASLQYLISQITGYYAEITNEDVISKSFDVIIDQDGSDPDMAAKGGKIAYLVDLFRPAGSDFGIIFRILYSDMLTIEQKSNWAEALTAVLTTATSETYLLSALDALTNIITFNGGEDTYTRPTKEPSTILNTARAKFNSSFVFNAQSRVDRVISNSVVIAVHAD